MAQKYHRSRCHRNSAVLPVERSRAAMKAVVIVLSSLAALAHAGDVGGGYGGGYSGTGQEAELHVADGGFGGGHYAGGHGGFGNGVEFGGGHGGGHGVHEGVSDGRVVRVGRPSHKHLATISIVKQPVVKQSYVTRRVVNHVRVPVTTVWQNVRPIVRSHGGGYGGYGVGGGHGVGGGSGFAGGYDHASGQGLGAVYGFGGGSGHGGGYGGLGVGHGVGGNYGKGWQ
ncbi:uncharacterized protein LOC135395144 [Ornithodoros turicata]|uniref:uncharacterized protein LOC135395144 n=1 Tax=Ornithodoros turicata TaxID=34597 RepID=UPI0031391BFC